MPSALIASLVSLALLVLRPLAWPAAPSAGTPAQLEAASWLEKLVSSDPATAARAENALIKLGPEATPALGGWLSGERRVAAAVPRVLRVISRVKDPAAMRILLVEWEHEESRDLLIDTWLAFGDACVSPLAGYIADAGSSRQERIVAALGRIGVPAVPALQGLKTRLSGDQTSLAERLTSLIDEAILTAPVVSLARKGRVAWHDLEEVAGDPASDARIAVEAVRGLIAITDGDEAPQALMRLSRKTLSPELHALIDRAADDARLIQVSRGGVSAIPEYGAIVRDPASRDGLRMGAANALFGLGRAALPELDRSAAAIASGELAAYVKGLADSLRAMPGVPGEAVGPRASTGSSTVAAPRPASSPCLGDAAFTELARFDSRDMPVSARWFRRSPDGTRLLFTTVEKGFYRLVEMRTDGTGRRAIAPFAHQLAPSWSSDGRELAFLAARAPIVSPGEYVDVYAGPIGDGRSSGDDYGKLTKSPGPYASPVWLPGRREVLYAANTFATPSISGADRTSSLLLRHDIATGRATPLASLYGRIITAIEPSPSGRHVAFLSWGAEGPGAGSLELHVIEADGASPLEMLLADAAGRPIDAREALWRGGDLTWSADGSRLTTTGRIVDVVSWRVDGLADPGDARYAILSASRTFLSEAGERGACAWFDDTRQILRRCPEDRIPVPVADCRGALLWFDMRDSRFGLFDPVYGVLGVVRLSEAGAARAPTRRSPLN